MFQRGGTRTGRCGTEDEVTEEEEEKEEDERMRRIRRRMRRRRSRRLLLTPGMGMGWVDHLGSF